MTRKLKIHGVRCLFGQQAKMESLPPGHDPTCKGLSEPGYVWTKVLIKFSKVSMWQLDKTLPKVKGGHTTLIISSRYPLSSNPHWLSSGWLSSFTLLSSTTVSLSSMTFVSGPHWHSLFIINHCIVVKENGPQSLLFSLLPVYCWCSLPSQLSFHHSHTKQKIG